MRQTQEDLWVYQSLLTIIKHLNDRADGHHNAKVKEIRSLLIGHDAAQRFQELMAEDRLDHVDTTGSKSGAAAGPGMPGPGGGRSRMSSGLGSGGPGGMPGGMSAGMSGGMGGGPAQRLRALDEGRYVDEKGMPLAAGASGPPEFKRMPILMQLLIDQREISRLLVECANSPLPVEVRQLRVRSPEPDGNVASPRPGRSSAAKLGGGARGGIDLGADDERDKSPYEVLIELQGIIYIFNPPDQAKLAPAATGEPGAAAEESTDSAAGDKEAAPIDVPVVPEAPAGAPDTNAPAEEQPAAEPAPGKGPQPANEPEEDNTKPAEDQPDDA